GAGGGGPHNRAVSESVRRTRLQLPAGTARVEDALAKLGAKVGDRAGAVGDLRNLQLAYPPAPPVRAAADLERHEDPSGDRGGKVDERPEAGPTLTEATVVDAELTADTHRHLFREGHLEFDKPAPH